LNELNKYLFELLQVAIGNRRELTRPLSADEWASLRLEFKKQGMLGIGYCGITRLPSEQCPPIQILAQWVHNAEKIRKKNEQLSAECASICETLEHDGIRCCVIKGQSNLVNYVSNGWYFDKKQKNPLDESDTSCTPANSDSQIVSKLPSDSQNHQTVLCQNSDSSKVDKPSASPKKTDTLPSLAEYRTPGDIDLWCKTRPEGIQIAVGNDQRAEYETYRGIAGIVEYAQQWRRLHDEKPIPWHRVLYYHVEISLPPTAADSQKGKDGTEVELHYRPSFLLNPIRNRRMQRWFEEQKTLLNPPLKGGLGFPIPTNSFNAVYQLVHIFRHLFEEGIGLRQLLDYYFVLRSLHIEQETLSGSPFHSTSSGQVTGESPDHWSSMGMWAESIGRGVSSNTEIMHTLGRLGMRKFAGAVMWVLQTALDPSLPSLASTKLSTGAGQELDWQKRWPWMLCPPNEKEGRFLLNEIMLAGNFGKYDDRIKHGGSQLSHAWEKTKHNMRLLTHYPEEVMWEPVFRLYHWLWRRFEWWRF